MASPESGATHRGRPAARAHSGETVRRRLIEALAGRLPFYYGWVILGVICAVAFSRQGPAVATLSIFIEPMTGEFGWSRTEISAAVSIGGILAAATSPLIGPFLDRNGARAVLCFAVLTTGFPLLLLSWTGSLLYFYLFYCVARMNFAGPYDLGIYGTIVNWFVRRRSFVTSLTTMALMSGLIVMPLIAHFTMQAADWRAAWVAVGLATLVLGFVPVWLLHVRRPEDLGLLPDGDRPVPEPAGGDDNAAVPLSDEPAYSRREAMATPAFWLLSLFTLLVYPIQAGISLHQAPLLIEHGLDATIAATAVSTFSLFSAIAGVSYGFWPRRIPLQWTLVLVALSLALSAFVMNAADTPLKAYVAAALFGCGIGGLVTMLPIAWADYFGRRSYGAIRGAALTVQVVAQAAGPLIAGGLRDLTGSYDAALTTFVGLGLAGAAAALLAKTPAGAGPKS
jgi:MFS transporter, OFA family, oxalate/formate antiporter